MKSRYLLIVGVLMLGCSGPADRDPESVVRAAIAAQFQVDAAGIEMDKPLSAPPLNGDDLDLVELVMAIEERLNVTIPDSVFGEPRRKEGDPLRVTPAQLVAIVRQAESAR